MNDRPEYRRTSGGDGKYHASDSNTEGSADESAEWGGEDMEESASEEDAATVKGVGAGRRQLTGTEGA